MWQEQPTTALWAVLLVISSGTCAYNVPYRNRPHLYSENGHLYITCSVDRNITLRTSGRGSINVNNDNLGEIVKKARRVSNTIERFQNTELPHFQTKISTLSSTVLGPRGLKERLDRLERSHRNSTTFSSDEKPNFRLSRLNDTVVSLSKDLASFRTLVSTDDCLSNPCQNGGKCYDLINGFHCICLDSWEGKICDTDVNECANFAGTDLGCQNNAQCVNKRGSYECLCSDGWYGIHCTKRTFDCTKSSSDEMCGMGFCASSGGSGKGFECICNQGWTTDANGRCTRDVNECEMKTDNCEHDPLVQCVNVPGSFSCGNCPPGYTGNGHYCADIDECAENNGGCSLLPKVKCINTRGSHYCFPCPLGYYGDGIICSTASGGPCSVNNGGCHQMATCVSSGGGLVSCQCFLGYTGNGYGINGCQTTSLVRSVCQHNYCKHGGTCIPQSGPDQSFICHCPQGFGGTDCGLRLENPCQNNPCLNNGNCIVTSTYSIHGFRCSCQIGFSGVRCQNEDSDCISTISLETGILSYPRSNTKAIYETTQFCHWVISVNETKVINIKFNSLNTEFNFNCNTEYIQIYDGYSNSSKTLGRFCGSTVPDKNITSSHHVISVYFVSQMARSQQEKFRLTFNAVEPRCGMVLDVKQAGLIESPGYPSAYPPNMDCWWVLSAPVGMKIKLSFYTLNLKKTPSSPCDHLKIYDGIESDRKEIANYCSETNPVPIGSNSDVIQIHLQSNQTLQGAGFRIGYDLVSGCGAMLTEATGDITPPRDTQVDHTVAYKDEVHCEWRIQLPVNERIVLNFVTFNLETCSECGCDYVELYDGPRTDSKKLGRWCGTTKPSKLISSSNVVTVIFHADFFINEGTFHLHYDVYCGGEFNESSGELMSPMYPNTRPSIIPCIYKIEQPLGKAIILKVGDLQLVSPSSCFSDFLEVRVHKEYTSIRDGDNENSTLIGKYCEANKLPQEILSTYNILFIKFLSATGSVPGGFRATYSTVKVGCGGILKETVGSIASPQENEHYPVSIYCSWVIVAPVGYFIQLSWVSFNVEKGRDCRYDYVQVFDNSTSTGQDSNIGKFCGTTIPPPKTSLDNIMTIVFQSDHSVSREGFLAHYHMLDGSKYCGGTFSSTMGELKSPNYPRNYPFNKECVFIIQVPTGQQIQLTIEKFDLEYHSRCDYDYLEIRNGGTETSPIIGKYCGTEVPSNIRSLANTLYLKFESDATNTFAGFRILWDGTSTGCGGIVTTATGSIFSPNYPQPYGSFGSCYWKITVSKGSRIQLTIVDIDLEDHVGCNLDYIQVFDGSSIKGKHVGKYCNGNHPPHILSSSNQMYIEFISDLSLEGRGFHLSYTSVCNTTLKGHTGVIESLNFPNPCPPNRECVWVIEAPRGNNISYSFSHFDLEEDGSSYEFNNEICSYDYVELTEGEGQNLPSRSLGKFCGNQLPPKNISTMDHVYVRYKSDNFFSRNNRFRLEWTVSGCGGILNRPYGFFHSPGYPGPYAMNIDCVWSIIVEWSTSIEITVSVVELEQSPGCNIDVLEIYGGPDDQSPQLAKLCYNKDPVVVTTSGNHAFVVFKADHSYTGKGFYATYHVIPSKCGGFIKNPAGEIASHNYPNNYENNEECEWLIEVPANHLINLTFIDFDIEEHQPYSNLTDIVNVYDGEFRNSNLLFNHSGKFKNLPVKSVVSTSNVLLVQFISDSSTTGKGFKAKYRIACGARIITSNSGSISTADAFHLEEDWSSDDMKCTWYIIAEDLESRVTLTFNYLDDIAYMQDDGKCLFRNITVYDGENEDGPILKHFCTKKLPAPIRSSGHALTLTLSKSPYMSFGIVEATYSVLSTACGGVFSSEHGVFASPNYPDGYPINSECIWEIKTSPGNRAMITFTDFDVESSEHCNLDYVEVRLGSASNELHDTFCGSHKPVHINSSSSFWIKFNSDEEGTAKGFTAEYSLFHGNDIYGIEGDIGSPFYPKSSYQEGTFKWVVNVDMGSIVRLIFKVMFIESFDYDGPCSDNALKIYDGRDDTAPLLGKFCGSQLPQPILSHGNAITIVFYIEHAILRGSVFLLHWEKASQGSTKMKEVNPFGNCSQTIELGLKPGMNSSHIFTSPGYPNRYKNDLNCEWIIETSPDNHVTLKFSSVNFEHFHNECFDYLQVFTETEEDSGWEQLNNDICLSSATNLHFVASHRMRVTMITDNMVKYEGFSATANIVCGGTIRGISGTVDTTYIKSKSDSQFTTCTWIIIVKSGKTIQVSFDKFDLTRETVCKNYILLRDGGHDDSPLLGTGKYCGSIKPAKMETSSNRLYITYSVRGDVPGVILKFNEVSVNCGGDFELTSEYSNINISSPNYPNVPPPHTVCIWKIYAPAGETIQFDIIDRFDLQRSYLCEKEYVELHNGGTEMSPIIGERLCNRQPSTLSTTDNMLYVKYFTDVKNPNNGFSANIRIGVCGGTMYVNSWSLGKKINSPNYPDSYPANSNCTWNIISPEGTSINFQFKEYQLRSTFGGTCTKNCDYLRVAEIDPLDPLSEFNNKTISGMLTPEMEAPIFKTDTNTAVLHFVSGVNTLPSSIRRFSVVVTVKRNYCGGKLEAESGIIQSPGYGSNERFAAVSSYCNWEITVPEGRRVTLKFIDFDLDPSVHRVDYFVPKVLVYNGIYKGFLKGFRGSEPSGTTVKSSGNKMLIFYINHFRTKHRGFKAEYSSHEPIVCGGSLEESGVINFHTEINQTAVWCDWIRTTDGVLNQTFVMQVNGTFGSYSKRVCRFKYNQDPVMLFGTGLSVLSDELGTYCSLKSTMEIIPSPFRKTAITFSYAGKNETNPINFTIRYKTNPCGGVINAVDTVVIKSPGYPEDYPPNMDCAWKINFPEGQINITFEAMHLEVPFSVLDDKRCTDYVSIHNGPARTDPMFDLYCGLITPDHLLSQSNEVWVEFHSNEAEQNKGFQIRMTSVSKGCGGKFHANEGRLHSPNFPNKYPNNIECEWEIQCDPGYRIGLTFVDRFYIEKSDGCVNDYVQIFDYKDGNWSSSPKLCDRKLPPTFNTTSTRIKILFRSNNIITSDGFKRPLSGVVLFGGKFYIVFCVFLFPAVWNVNCGGEYMVVKGGVITSPHYPSDYPDFTNCTYTLFTKSGSINGQFVEPFAIEESENCNFDNLTVTTYTWLPNYFNRHPSAVLSRAGKEENIYCSNQLPPAFNRKQKVVLSFVTDFYGTDSGFYFNYSVNTCGNDNMTKPGIIVFPQEREFQECVWNIKAPKNKIVILRIRGFSSLSTCQIYLNIWDGPIGSKLMRKYCGYFRADEFRSTNNTLTVAYISEIRWSLPYTFSGTVDFSYSCGGTINVTQDSPYILKSLDVDDNGKYEENLKCDWNIIAPSAFLLQVTFLKMDIDNCTNINSTNCGCDYLQIYDGSHEGATSIGRFCNTRVYPPVTSTTNQVFIRFVTDGNESKSGFEVKIQAKSKSTAARPVL